MRGSGDGYAQRHIGSIVLNNENVLLRPYYAEIIAGIHTAAHENSYHVRFIRFFNNLKDPLLFNELIHTDEICGLIMVSLDQSIITEKYQNLIFQRTERITNLVTVEWSLDGIPSVNFNRQEAARSAVEYLFNKGYEDIIYIGENDNRIAGFRQAYIDRGIVDLGSLVIEHASDMKEGFKLASNIFSQKNIPRAIFAGSDEVAIGILRYLNMEGIVAPDKVALISIDNIEISAFTNPPLTTINVQKSQMGRHAVKMIIENSRKSDHPIINLTLPTSLVERESC